MSTPGRSRITVRQALRDRCLTVTGPDDVPAIIGHIDLARGGLAISSNKPLEGARASHASYPALVLVIDPREKHEQVATPEGPVALPPSGMFGDCTLAEVIEGQLQAGADIGVVPGRYVQAEDLPSLRALIGEANTLGDVLVRVQCSYALLRPDSVRQVIAILKRSKNPVALSLGDRADPLEHRDIPQGLRTVAGEVPDLVPWRTDLAGLDALAHGALATAIGVLPSYRHACPPGQRGRAIDKQDKTPKVFLPSLLRYVRASYLHEDWFASKDPWKCGCAACGGRAIDRFTGSAGDRREAHVHNVIALTELHRALVSEPVSSRPQWWHIKLREAEAAHQQLSIYIEKKISLPEVLQFWLDHP